MQAFNRGDIDEFNQLCKENEEVRAALDSPDAVGILSLGGSCCAIVVCRRSVDPCTEIGRLDAPF